MKISDIIKNLKDLSLAVSPGRWTTENEHQGKWNIYDEEGNDLAMTHQLVPIPQDPKQVTRTANAVWIAAASPANIMALVEELEQAQAKLELVAQTKNHGPVYVTWQYPEWVEDDSWSAEKGTLIHFDTSEKQKHVVLIKGNPTVLENVTLKLESGQVIKWKP